MVFLILTPKKMRSRCNKIYSDGVILARMCGPGTDFPEWQEMSGEGEGVRFNACSGQLESRDRLSVKQRSIRT